MIPEIFEAVQHAKTKKEKIETFQKNDTPALRTILKVAFDKQAYKWDLPEGSPPFKAERSLPKGYASTSLYVEARRMYIFNEAYKLPRIRKETLYIQILEGIHWTEADLLNCIKNGEVYAKYKISEDLVREAFPDLLTPKPAKVKTKDESQPVSDA
jgi:hypothetical protein